MFISVSKLPRYIATLSKVRTGETNPVKGQDYFRCAILIPDVKVRSSPVGSFSSGKACLQLLSSFPSDIRVRRWSTLGYQLTRPTKLIVSRI
ncbi:hypothetical protein NPIL_482751 [Nephila pilipes]|uniref:Uncharacterized protein n=1 Tax=Nephila pilipes TaxID=299642 RepID=A0A8X6TR75_NEPPI|nr:hypothetical protein NPIL_482751 [Nephila pilipes]